MDIDTDSDLYRQIFSSHPHATILFGLMDGRIEDVNEAALALYGYGRGEMVGLPFTALAAEPDAKLHRRKDGSMLAINAHRSTVKIGGREVGVAVIHEMSAPRTPQQESGAAESRFRLLADGIGQDLGGILTSILGLTELAIKAMPASDPARMDLEEVRRLGQRAMEVSASLKV